MWPDLWFRQNQSRIHIGHDESRAMDLFERFFHKNDRISALPFRVRRWEVAADIASSHGAQQCISQCMEQDIAVGVAGEAFVMGKLDAADSEGDAFFEFVRIPAQTNSHFSPLIY